MIFRNWQDTSIPALGFGTYELDNAAAEKMVVAAAEIGYRHFDTAQMYHNEEGVGRGLKSSGLARDDYFLTTKIWPDNFQSGDLQTSVVESLRKLDLDHVDLLLLHWPTEDVPLRETIAALNEVKNLGMTRLIGISNFPTELIERAVGHSALPLAVNQVEYHPYLDQSKVLECLRANNMLLTAYCPLARAKVLNDPTLRAIGDAHGKSAAQVTLRWLLQQDDVMAIPKSGSPKNAKANFEIFDFNLSEAEMADITELAISNGRLIDPDFAPKWD
ncbi:aldo/keto reductase [Thalassospira alkalitolerans]|uniref:2,5-didehydrogluconate reductase n=1 Tax=Thalassospira alkalitolerans TaxID=1293890 RepID=A0A1Y2LC90_9PROT|nr:aldo/keto reductase [Thalassospira alkalitolerans]OSQ48417.1 2,5-didehydrogluconate reductase [Thalassospira alkalitolerans]|tara:strand:- start:9351 stop:10172 length:822 start_codon:yes stop_codon:yes gene_type:complete